MENQPKPYPFVSAEQLLQRQIADWKQLQQELQEANAPADRVVYCETQIKRLRAELAQLPN